MKIGVLGAGSWGTALAIHLNKQGHEVTLWGHSTSGVSRMKETRSIGDKLPGVLIPEEVALTDRLAEAASEKELLVFAVPSPAIRETAEKVKPYAAKGQIAVSVAKGLEERTLLRLSRVIEEELPECEVAVLCGPSHAEEVALGLPTALVAGAEKRSVAEKVQNAFMEERLRVYTSPDVAGMEMGGALKNVIALAAGMADGLGFGDNTKAALITRGIHEIIRLAVKLGGAAETITGLTGIGDLIVTCESRHSRNRKAGMLIGQGKSLSEALSEVGMVVEGVNTARSAKRLADQYEVSMPIISEVNEVLFSGRPAKEAVTNLMIRDKRIENTRLEWKHE